MKTQTYSAIFGSVLAVLAAPVDARDNDRVVQTQRHGRDYTPSHDYRNDHRRNDDHRHGDGRHHGHHGNNSHHGSGHTQQVYADVISVEPIFEIVHVDTPVQDCRQENAVYYERHNTGPGMVLGGVIGATIGHDIARNTGNDVAVVAGTLLGAVIGHDIGHSRTTVVSEPRVYCETRTSHRQERHITGYRVKYSYYDRIYYTRTDYHPGHQIRVTISLNN